VVQERLDGSYQVQHQSFQHDDLIDREQTRPSDGFFAESMKLSNDIYSWSSQSCLAFLLAQAHGAHQVNGEKKCKIYVFKILLDSTKHCIVLEFPQHLGVRYSDQGVDLVEKRRPQYACFLWRREPGGQVALKTACKHSLECGRVIPCSERVPCRCIASPIAPGERKQYTLPTRGNIRFKMERASIFLKKERVLLSRIGFFGVVLQADGGICDWSALI
jgi:hypothetical protein